MPWAVLGRRCRGHRGDQLGGVGRRAARPASATEPAHPFGHRLPADLQARGDRADLVLVLRVDHRPVPAGDDLVGRRGHPAQRPDQQQVLPAEQQQREERGDQRGDHGVATQLVAGQREVGDRLLGDDGPPELAARPAAQRGRHDDGPAVRALLRPGDRVALGGLGGAVPQLRAEVGEGDEAVGGRDRAQTVVDQLDRSRRAAEQPADVVQVELADECLAVRQRRVGEQHGHRSVSLPQAEGRARRAAARPCAAVGGRPPRWRGRTGRPGTRCGTGTVRRSARRDSTARRRPAASAASDVRSASPSLRLRRRASVAAVVWLRALVTTASGTATSLLPTVNSTPADQPSTATAVSPAASQMAIPLRRRLPGRAGVAAQLRAAVLERGGDPVHLPGRRSPDRASSSAGPRR